MPTPDRIDRKTRGPANPKSPMDSFRSSLLNALQKNDPDVMNRLIVDALKCGTISAEDFDFSENHGDKNPLKKALHSSNDLFFNGQNPAIFWLHAWEWAMKTGQLNKVLREFQSPLSSSPLLEKGKTLMEAFLPRSEKNHLMSVKFKACAGGPQAADGVLKVRFQTNSAMRFSASESDFLKTSSFQKMGHIVERVSMSKCAQECNTDHVDRARAGLMLLECGQSEWMTSNDPDIFHQSKGTLFWSEKSHRMDAFLASRVPLKILEEALDGAAGENDSLQAHLSGGLNPNVTFDHHHAPSVSLLSKACAHANADALEALIAHGALVAPSTNMDLDPLVQLLAFSHKQDKSTPSSALEKEAEATASSRLQRCLHLLVSSGLNLDEPLVHEHTPLMVACTHKNAWALIGLIQEGADPAAKGASGLSLLDLIEQQKAGKPRNFNHISPACMTYMDAWIARQVMDRITSTKTPSI